MNYILGPTIEVDAMIRTPMNEDDKKSNNYTHGSFSRTGDITEECLLDITLIAHHQEIEYCQLKEYVRDNKLPYTEAKLHGEHIIL